MTRLAMSTTLRLCPSPPRPTPAGAPFLVVLAVFACTDRKDTDPAPPSAPTMLMVELPAGVEIGIDGGERRAAPLSLEVEPGTHTLTLVTACQALELPIETPAGATTRVDRERAKGLQLATLDVSARDLDGELLPHSVLVDEALVGGGTGTSTTVVPACRYRMRVASEGVGGFIEDIDLRQEARAEREIVLSPGPDMVRIHGGRFTLGPPASSTRTEGRWDLAYPTKDVVFSTFDMDKTEVTAAQFHECRASGRCSWNWGRDITLDEWPRFPLDEEERFCTSTLDYSDRKPVPGRENHPMNCVSYHEAEMYCAAVGKRLPTAAEWEFAGRSRNAEYYCPWRPPEDVSADSPVCNRARMYELGTHQVCLHPEENTEQGLCDMPWNVAEFVTNEHIQASRWMSTNVASRGGWNERFIDGMVIFLNSSPRSGLRGSKYEPEPSDQDVRIGFRCVRDATSSHSRAPSDPEG
jgi:formylglycine-generating enzyme required for sulfatase activity